MVLELERIRNITVKQLCFKSLIYGCKDCCGCSGAAWDDVGCTAGGGGGGGWTPGCVLGEGGGVGRLNLSGLLLLLGEGLAMLCEAPAWTCRPGVL